MKGPGEPPDRQGLPEGLLHNWQRIGGKCVTCTHGQTEPDLCTTSTSKHHHSMGSWADMDTRELLEHAQKLESKTLDIHLEPPSLEEQIRENTRAWAEIVEDIDHQTEKLRALMQVGPTAESMVQIRTTNPQVIKEELEKLSVRRRTYLWPWILSNPNVTREQLTKATWAQGALPIETQTYPEHLKKHLNPEMSYQFLRECGAIELLETPENTTFESLKLNWEGSLSDLIKAAEELT